MTSHATHTRELMGIPPTGKQVTCTANSIFRRASGKIAEAWLQQDMMGLLQ